MKVLNVARPRASEDTQIYSDVIIILEQVVQILTDEDRKSKVQLEHSKKGKPSIPPKTVEEAVERLVGELSLKEKRSSVIWQRMS